MPFTAGIGRSSAFGKRIKLFVMGALALVSGAANATFITESDGVVLDMATGLEWQPNANSIGAFIWSGAVSHAAAVSLDGGGWHLPSIGDLQTLYNEIHALGGCSGTNCTGNQGPFTNIQPFYWSATEFDSSSAWIFFFNFGVQGVGSLAHFLGQVGHFGDAPGIVGDRTVGIERDDHTGERQHRGGRQRNAEQAATAIGHDDAGANDQHR